jgi:S1-C subfamily serine protease
MATVVFRKLLILVLLVGCQTADPRIESARRVWRFGTSRSYGTAFPVSRKQLPSGKWQIVFLTANHLLRNPSNLSVHLKEKYLIKGKLIARHPKWDAGLVAFESDDPEKILPLRWDPLTLGEEVWSVGYQARTLWVTRGIATMDRRISAPSWPGGSGGPILDVQGRVAGILVAIGGLVNRHGDRVLVPHQSWIVSLSDLESWVQSKIS